MNRAATSEQAGLVPGIARAPEDVVPAGEQVTLRWQWPGGMFMLCLTNFILRLATLGVYHFWAKTETRKKIWSGVRLNDEPLAYTGRGLELFLGFAIVAVVVLLPLMAGYLWLIVSLGPESIWVQVLPLIAYAPAFLLFGFAFYRAQRYQRARTRWRGIRFSLEGTAAKYAWTYVWTTLLIPVTAGWIQPWRLTALQNLVTSNTMFGDRKMRFDADAGPLYPTYAGFWFGIAAVFVIGGSIFFGGVMSFKRLRDEGQIAGTNVVFLVVAIYGVLIVGGLLYALLSAWFRSRTINHFADHTRFEGGNFVGRVRARGLIWITVSNFLLRLLSLAVFGGAIVAALYMLVPAGEFMKGPEELTEAERQLRGAIGLGLAVLFIAAWSFFGPIIQARTTGYVVSRLGFDGTVSIEEIAQGDGADVRTGEGMAEAFDIDVLG